MQTLKLVQGSPEWLAHRRTSFNASDAPAMLGCSPYKTRTALLHEMATGIAPEVDPATQRRFDDGHRFEALARQLAEQIIGETLYPVTGADGKYSASFDGLTLGEDVAFEHKTLNNELRSVLPKTVTGGIFDAPAALPLYYRVQMEHQMLVSVAEKNLFMASKWKPVQQETPYFIVDENGVKNYYELVEERHCWYVSDAALRAEIVAGWKQFEQDLAAYVPPERAAIVVATQVQALPSVLVQVSGSIIVTDNFADFQIALTDFLEHRLIREPKTDQDFADLEVQIKAMKGAEAALDAAEGQMLAQIVAVDQAKKTKDMLSKLVRDNRLMAEKLLASEKERRRAEIVTAGVAALKAHIDELNTRLGEPYMPVITADFGGVVKGLKSLSSMQDRVSSELARCKIAANEMADRIQVNMKKLVQAGDSASFHDAAALVLKAPDDLTAIIAHRIAEAERRAEAAREAIRKEEQAKAEKAAREKLAAEQAATAAAEKLAKDQAEAAARASVVMPDKAAADKITSRDGLLYRNEAIIELPEADQVAGAHGYGCAEQFVKALAPTPVAAPAPAASAVDTGACVKLGDINAAIAPLSISSDGLASLGFTHIAAEKAAKLYLLADLPEIYAAMVRHIDAVRAKLAA